MSENACYIIIAILAGITTILVMAELRAQAEVPGGMMSIRDALR